MDLRRTLELFATSGDLRRIKVSVSLELELAALCRREFAAGHGLALLFEQLHESRFCCAANLFGSEQRAANILRCNDYRAFTEKLQNTLARQQGTAQERLVKIAAATAKKPDIRKPLWHKQAAATLLDLPAIKSWPQERKSYLTLPLVVSRHPLNGELNIGLYRVQVINKLQAAINFQPNSGAGKHLAVARELDSPLSVALVFGGDLALYWLAAAPLPTDCHDYRFFHNFFAEQLPLAECATQELQVPAAAEFVVEGFISPKATCHEGPFGNHTGSYVTRTDCPLLQVTSIAWREQAIMPLTVVGPPPSENIYLAKANEILLQAMLRIDFPEITALKMPDLTIFHGATLLQVGRLERKTARELIEELWTRSPLKNAKLLLLVDEDIDLAEYGQAYWRILNQFDSSRIYQRGQQFAIDATGVDPKLLVVEDSATTKLLQQRCNEYDS